MKMLISKLFPTVRLHAWAFPAVALMTLSFPPMNAKVKVPIMTIHARRYEFIPSSTTLELGKTVELVLVSDDIIHGLSVDGLGIDLKASKNQPAHILITPNKAGDFEGQCSRYCGAGHSEMKLLIHVVNSK
jgi:cytochrome c oxidase subunit 2